MYASNVQTPSGLAHGQVTARSHLFLISTNPPKDSLTLHIPQEMQTSTVRVLYAFIQGLLRFQVYPISH